MDFADELRCGLCSRQFPTCIARRRHEVMHEKQAVQVRLILLWLLLFTYRIGARVNMCLRCAATVSLDLTVYNVTYAWCTMLMLWLRAEMLGKFVHFVRLYCFLAFKRTYTIIWWQRKSWWRRRQRKRHMNVMYVRRCLIQYAVASLTFIVYTGHSLHRPYWSIRFSMYFTLTFYLIAEHIVTHWQQQ